ncbi:RING-type domain-containing protein [Mycena kentingensis (nom. inval.)]|nr:RING-type domain-containing protein [Mycena kentingensis (nom. inval.)]
MNLAGDVVEEALAGREVIVSHPGASQYQVGGIAACGLAGLNFVRVALARVESGFKGRALLKDLVSRKTSEEIISICSQWQSNGHLEVEEIAQVPLFERAFELNASIFGAPSLREFERVLSTLKSLHKHAAVCVTRPPEIVTIFKLEVDSTDMFVIFDSHPRPTHPNGAGFVVNSSIHATASHLDNLLAVDARLVADTSLQWQTQLLANFSGHFFIPKSSPVNTLEGMTQAVLESSLVALRLQAQVAELQSLNTALMRERTVLETDAQELREKYLTVKAKYKSLAKGAPTYRDAAQPIASTSKLPAPPKEEPPKNLDALEYFHNASNIQRPSRVPPQSMDRLIAQQMQMDVVSEQFPPLSASSSRRRKNQDADFLLAAKMQSEWEQREREDAIRAVEKQREFEAEDMRLNAERAALQRMQQKVFSCPLCLEQLPEDDVAVLHGCKHKVCRGCMRGYVGSKLGDKIYPIYCPTCLADAATTDPGTVTDDLVQTLGLTDDEYQILQELQIASLSILIHCRKCKESVFVDRHEHDATEVIACPLPRCNFAWCKACQQEILMGSGPKHSCDGSSEMEHLLAQRKWKRCPGCKTPFQKSTGCNHMTCMAPGCNTHFCYLCGDSIVRSALASEIRAEVSRHYRRCQLFEDV